ncbi:DUF6515 family protein [Desulfosediminicola flagellatus]|uniref:DUF6515 family protein n=1 Tax=Desulfosediminicola flagellatus TaxID=2569541 RepID=UPI0010ACCF67|nr:DUF6515 family protein [Desulfosediminicola flagellatus]
MTTQRNTKKRVFNIRHPLIITTSTLMLALTTVTPTTVMARPPGFQMRQLPLGHHIVHVGSLVFYFLDGVFFRRAPHGFVVAPAPIGAVVLTIPPESLRVTADKTVFFTYDGVYYQKVPEGYMVVERPSKPHAPLIAKGTQIRVAVDILNVRSGPGLEHSVVRHVKHGEILTIEASQIDWAFVKLPDSSFGWIKLKYAIPVEPAAMG